jgi:hypothetical protein
MEAKKETVEAGSEAPKSDFIQRVVEMSDVLMDMADQKAASRAVLIVAIEDDDKGDTNSAGVIGGNEEQLLKMFKAMWHDKNTSRFMRMAAFIEMGKVVLNDGRK